MDESRSYLLARGTILRDRYRVEALLGEGGFGITYRGTETKLRLRLAIKEYYPYNYALRDVGISNDVLPKADEKSQRIFAANKERFLVEAQKLAQCDQIQSVVRVIDYFEDNQTAYIVMEYLEGITLKRLLEDNGKVEAAWICRLMEPMLRDLIKVHGLYLLHRDISPDNIMLLDGERLKLLDFGAACDYDDGEYRSITVLLKHGFAPYEQYTRHGHQGPWTDLYALSATLYTCITNVVPDPATDRKMQDDVKPPSELGIVIDAALEKVIMKGMSVDPKDRYQNAWEMAEALHSALIRSLQRGTIVIPDDPNDEGFIPPTPGPGPGHTVGDPFPPPVPPEDPPVPPEDPPAPPEDPPAPPEDPPVPPKKKPYIVWIVGGVLVVCLMLAAYRFWIRPWFEPDPAPTPTTEPTVRPTAGLTAEPTQEPTAEPTQEPTAEPTQEPTAEPTQEPTAEPTQEPTAEPTQEPTAEPTAEPADIVPDDPTAEYYDYKTLPDGTLEIVGYSGIEEMLKIPAAYRGTKITAIGDNAFYENKLIREVVIPHGITHIGDRAFNMCERLESLTISGTVETIGENPFVGCKQISSLIVEPENEHILYENGFLIVADEKRLVAGFGHRGELVIPQSVELIGGQAFQENTGIESVIIPEGVRSIGRYAFYNCTSLKTVRIPDSVVQFGNMAFGNDMKTGVKAPKAIISGRTMSQQVLIQLAGLEYEIDMEM